MPVLPGTCRWRQFTRQCAQSRPPPTPPDIRAQESSFDYSPLSSRPVGDVAGDFVLPARNGPRSSIRNGSAGAFRRSDSAWRATRPPKHLSRAGATRLPVSAATRHPAQHPAACFRDAGRLLGEPVQRLASRRLLDDPAEHRILLGRHGPISQAIVFRGRDPRTFRASQASASTTLAIWRALFWNVSDHALSDRSRSPTRPCLCARPLPSWEPHSHPWQPATIRSRRS